MARMVRAAKDRPWSSYRALAGQAEPAETLTIDWVLGYFAKIRKTGSQKYREFVSVGKGQLSPWDKLKNQVFLGSDEFVEDAQAKMRIDQPLKNIPRLQKLAPVKPLDYSTCEDRTRADIRPEDLKSPALTTRPK